MHLVILIPILLLSLLFTACVKPPQEDCWVENTFSNRTGYPLPKDPTSLEFQERVTQLLSTNLTADTSVETALLNNASLQADLEEVGIARADLWQACLISNPILSGFLRFPHPSSVLNSEADLTMPLMDLILQPLRKRAACYKLAAVKAKTAFKALSFVADVKEAFYKVQAAEQLIALENQRLNLAELIFEITFRQWEAGNVGCVELTNAQSNKDASMIELLKREQKFISEGQKLAKLLGLKDLTGITLSEKNESEKVLQPLLSLEEQALEKRLDLWALYQEMLLIAQEGALKSWWTYTEVSGGISFENESDRIWELGPSIQLSLPLFDHGQAARQKLLVQFNQAKKRYRAKEIEIAGEVIQAYNEAEGWQDLIEEGKALASQNKIRIQETQKLYNVMTASVFDLLEAKESLLETEIEIKKAERAYCIAKARLDEAVGTSQ